ncbi:helix-turn-helix domain-containing protein [Desulfamplus magnetovallimortis]|nr:helix-turn-helix domain-containing protein [Desulfamplus magnetovallimortis]
MVERAVILSPDEYLKLDHFLPKKSTRRIISDTSKEDMEALIDKKIQAVLDSYFHGNQTHIKNVQSNVDIEPFSSHGQISIPSASGQIKPLDETIKESIQAALATTRGRVHGPDGAAQLLGLNPSTLCNKMRKLGIDKSKLC